MTIQRSFKMVDQKRVEGFQIGCDEKGCDMVSFLVAKKHLPPEVVTRKFQERRWDVSKKEQVCPRCIEKHRHRKFKAPIVVHSEKMAPVIEQLPLTASILARIIAEAGFPGAQAVELKPKDARHCPRFRIDLTNTTQVHMGRLMSAESRIMDCFDSKVETSYLGIDLAHVNGGSTVSVSAKFVWVIALEKNQHEPVHESP